MTKLSRGTVRRPAQASVKCFSDARACRSRWRHSDDALNLSTNRGSAQLIIRTRSHLHLETNDAAFVPVVYAGPGQTPVRLG
jgi:hypothetical protein